MFNNEMKYTRILFYKKRAALAPYADTAKIAERTSESMRKWYEKERDIELIAMFRWEPGSNGCNRCFCKIKCPINPLPVKGEFETPGMNVIRDFINQDGWELTQDVYTRLLR